MRDSSLFIVALGVILVNTSSCRAQNFGRSSEDEPIRMASDSLVVKSYREDEDNAPAEEDFRSYQGVMGRPGIDFPVLRNIPATDFNCRDVKRPGYYADLATDCQVFHICDGGRKISFLCPNGTIFRQSHLICDWWFRVDCGKSAELYEESAEQLAADQKIYQARSIERERRKKLKTPLSESEEEASGEVYGLDEPFNGRSRSRERNSKKVLDSKSAEKFPNYYKPGVKESANEDKIKFNRGTAAFNNHSPPSEAYQSFTPATTTTFSTSGYKIRQFGDNHRNRENIQGAESGSLVGNLRNSARHENSINFQSKLPEFKVLIPTTSQRPFLNFRSTTTEGRTQDFFRPSTFRPETTRRFFDSTQTTANTENRNSQANRVHSFVRTTPKYATTEKYTTTQPFRFFSTTEHKRFSSPRPSSTPSPFTRSTLRSSSPKSSTSRSESRKSFLTTEATEDENLTTEIIPVETVYYRSFGAHREREATTTSRIDVSLSELNINKPTSETERAVKTFEEAVRQGLEVPPSSGPNALRSFALYFAGNGGDAYRNKYNADDAKDLFYIPTVTEVEQKLNTFEDNGKDVVEEVEAIIDGSGPSTEKPSSAADTLPNSLTQQTKESYSALFDKDKTATEKSDHTVTESEFGTTAFEGFTEDALKINLELRKNDLDGSQSRGLVESDSNNNNHNKLNEEFSRVSPDLRELAQVFTKALSAYLDDPEAFRKVLSEVRPTEPAATEVSTNPIDYPSVTQEDDEVLDFSDVTKSSRRRTTTVAYRETTTEFITEPPTTIRDVENFVVGENAKLSLPNDTQVQVPSLELTAPVLENLYESQSNYYTPPPKSVATTNGIAEAINSGLDFTGPEKLPDIDSNEAVDSYLPLKGSVDDKSRPRYGGFQNNTKYAPYGSELSTKSYTPYSTEPSATTPGSFTKVTGKESATTFNPRNISSSILFRRKPERISRKQQGQASILAKQLNNLAALDEVKEVEEDTAVKVSPPVSKFESIKLGNGETIERTRTRATTERQVISTKVYQEPKELSIELSPPFNTDPSDGYYEFDPAGEYQTTTDPPTTITEAAETFLPTGTITTYTSFDSSTAKYARSTTEEPATDATAPTPKSFERIAELQQTLMFNSHNITHQQMEKARITVAEAVDNMTETTADALMKMMEMAAKNETYRRLVLLLVNDKSGRNKTVEETRLALLRALLMPVISTSRTRRLDEDIATTISPTMTTTTTTTTTTTATSTTPAATTTESPKRRSHFRRSKSISNGETGNVIRITTETPTERSKNGRKTKARLVSRIVKTTEVPTGEQIPKNLTNLEVVNRTVESFKSKDFKTNSLEDAILDSDSRAVELLRSLYSLAARWG